MNIQNPPVFDHIVAGTGENVKLKVYSIGVINISAGADNAIVNLPTDCPPAANILGFTIQSNNGGGTVASDLPNSNVSGSQNYHYRWFIVDGPSRLQVYQLTDAGAARVGATTLYVTRLMIWYV